jgi:ABC-type branched-subunit amino acid transport system ATPase component
MGLLNFEWTGGQHRKPGATPVLAVERVSVRLGQRLVLDDVSLEVFEGEQVRITGPNGAGKSTLLNAIMGIVPTTAGRILFKGEDMMKLPTHERAKLGIRYMRQRNNVFPSLSVRENLNLSLGSAGYALFLERYTEWAKDIQPETTAAMLSGGQKQKLAWSMNALATSPLLLFDEASAGSSDKLSLASGMAACFVEHN